MKSNRLYYSFFVILLFFSSHFCYSQKQGNIWYFGQNAGLDFNSCIPISINGGKINTEEGVATISDENGQLLFYTDGSTIWNKNHSEMSGGTGLIGNWTSTQSAIIVPKPGSSIIYYVFTVDYQANPNGLCYSIVNMSLDGGLGAVEAKNLQLISPVSEKITAVKHSNERDIWVVTNKWNSNAIYAFLVTENGLNTIPVISNAGRMLPNSIYASETIGYLKASPDGSKLASAHYSLGVDLMDFNNSTGEVSNRVELNTDKGCYGVEFSPNSSLLYLTAITSSYTDIIVQYEITLPNALGIVNSRKIIDLMNEAVPIKHYGALQLAPDGKIYVAVTNANYISSINYPDNIGTACDFVRNAVSVFPNKSELGLPSFIQSYFKKDSFIVNGSCKSQQLQFNYQKPENVNSIKWDFGDPASGINNTSTLLNTSHYYSSPGDYTVKLIRSFTCGNDTIIKQVKADDLFFSLGNDTTICNSNSFEITPALTGNFNYLWQNNSSVPSLNATMDGEYWVEVTRVESGCKSRDSINIRFSKTPQVSLDENVVLCDGKEKLLKPQVQDATGVSYLWQDGSTNADYLVTTEGNYSVSLSNDCGTVTKQVNVKKLECKIYVPTAFTPNGDGLNDYLKVISGLEIIKFDFIVFNRWGQKVFQTNDVNKGWDGFFQGKLIPGVYVWVMNYSTQDVNNQQLKGTVTLIK